jgi:hypothetical protein
LTEHGPLTWAALSPLLAEEAWGEDAQAWMQGLAPDEEHQFEDLLKVLHRLWVAQLREELGTLIGEGQTDRESLSRVAVLNARIKAHLQAERDLTPPA